MFEVVESGQKVSKEAFDREEDDLRITLLKAQQDLRAVGAPVVILVGGVDAAGKGETVNMLMQWFDPRGVSVYALDDPTDEERERPPFWRFWRRLPRRGQISILLGSWYTDPIIDRVMRRSRRQDLERQVQDIVNFERTLTDDGVVMIKLWMHLSKEAQKKRLQTLAKDPLHGWRVTPEDWDRYHHYKRFSRICENVLRKTGSGLAPWHLVEAANRRFQYLTTAHIVRDALETAQRGIAGTPPPPKAVVRALLPEQRSILSTLDYTAVVEKSDYRKQLDQLQQRLGVAAMQLSRQRRSAIIVFEGSDAAGKGGTIRRMTAAMDARNYHVNPIAAPSEEERAHPYLWRFWTRLPRAGRISIFDRSWYGRVLVEPAEALCSHEQWLRSYGEINEFEENLIRHGVLVIKFWLAVTADEQLRRFQERERVSFKQYKITAEDWRNREKWSTYEALIQTMVERTSTNIAPWVLVPSNDKYHARLQCLKALCERLED